MYRLQRGCQHIQAPSSRLVRIEFSLRLSELIRFSSCLPLPGAQGVRWNLTDVGHQELHVRPHILLGPRKTNICWSTLCLGLLRQSQHGPHATVPTRDDCDRHSQLVSELLPFPVLLGCIFIIGVTPIIKVGPLPQKIYGVLLLVLSQLSLHCLLPFPLPLPLPALAVVSKAGGVDGGFCSRSSSSRAARDRSEAATSESEDDMAMKKSESSVSWIRVDAASRMKKMTKSASLNTFTLELIKLQHASM